MTKTVLCTVCRNEPARYPTAEHPTCHACNEAIRWWQDKTREQLGVVEARARAHLMAAVVKLRRVHAARFGVPSLAPFTPRQESGDRETHRQH